MAEDTIGYAAPSGRFHHAHSLADTRLTQLSFVSETERAALARVPVTTRPLRAGDTLVAEGSTPENLYFLSAGWAYRYNTMQAGGRQISALLVPGGVCNIDNLMFKRADFGVRALTQATVLALPRHRALSLGSELPGVGRAFTWFALAENAILSQWAVGLGRRSAHQRLAHFFCEMDRRLSGDGSFELPMTQEVIADMLGLTAVHVNRVMQTLRAQGLIAVDRRTLTILDNDGLRALAEFDPSYLDQIEESGASVEAP